MIAKGEDAANEEKIAEGLPEQEILIQGYIFSVFSHMGISSRRLCNFFLFPLCRRKHICKGILAELKWEEKNGEGKNCEKKDDFS